MTAPDSIAPQEVGPSLPIALTRDNLASGKLRDMLARSAPEIRLLSADEMRQSLTDALDQRPPGDPWVFGYGSLIWNPTIHHLERRAARVQGWHRRFCLSTPVGRGSPDNPGLLLGMDQGGSCTGAAFRLDPEILTDELALLWRREMLTGAYVPRWLPMQSLDGEMFGHGLLFTINHAAANYSGPLEPDEIVRRIATARGAMGSSRDYLLHTRDGLRQLGIEDAELEALAEQVEAYKAA